MKPKHMSAHSVGYVDHDSIKHRAHAIPPTLIFRPFTQCYELPRIIGLFRILNKNKGPCFLFKGAVNMRHIRPENMGMPCRYHARTIRIANKHGA